MNRNDSLVDNYEEALAALLMSQVAEYEGQRFEKENEMLNSDPDFDVPPELDSRCIEAIRKAAQKEEAKLRRYKAYRVLYRAAVFAVVILTMFTTAYAIFPEVRAGVANLVTDIREIATVLRMEDIPPADAVADKKLTGFTYSGIPSSYRLVNRVETSSDIINDYKDDNGSYINVSIASARGAQNYLNSENAIEIKELTVSGHSVLLIIRENYNILSLSDTENYIFFTVIADALTETELLSIAESYAYTG